ncbi:hypothetical protein WCE14_09230 [Acinetobacter schindleri]|uniref:hypothetical protein n=1 Tax=Acinetobacter schindleri TaxID=108981 RepID=UPI0034D76C11
MTEQKMWCVAIAPEDDTELEQAPAVSKEIAERAVARYRAMHTAEGNKFLIESFDELIQVQEWKGTPEEHKNAEFIYDEAWFGEPMYQCKNLEQAVQVFKYGEIVHCYKLDGAELITSDFEQAKSFYEVA